MIITNWVVLTGGPSSGKTTTIRCLKDRGYSTVGEIARKIISKKREELSFDELKEYVNSRFFEFDIFEDKIELEERLNPNKLLFLDRGIPDSKPYFKKAGLRTDSVDYASRFFKYRKVFWLAPIEWKADDLRSLRGEDWAEAERIGKEIFEAYVSAGYVPGKDLIVVPAGRVDDRVDFILNNLRSGRGL